MRSRNLPSFVRSVALFASLAMLVPVVTGGIAGCRRKAAAENVADGVPPAVTDASTDLLLTWIDERGEFHVEQKVEGVPAVGRDLVRVVDPSREVTDEGRIFIADLRAARPDGSYAVRAAPREEFESVAVARREKRGGTTLAPKAAASAPPNSASASGSTDGTGRPTVIVYGASWCGPCHQAQAWLKQHNIDFIEKDIEEDASAAREMQAKLSRSGKRGGSIPVIDVRGRILVGFDPRAVDRALKESL